MAEGLGKPVGPGSSVGVAIGDTVAIGDIVGIGVIGGIGDAGVAGGAACASTRTPLRLPAATAARISPRNHLFTCLSSTFCVEHLYPSGGVTTRRFAMSEAGAGPRTRKLNAISMPVPVDGAPAAQQLFLKAQSTWSARATPRFESFVLPCAVTFLEARCAPEAEVRFIVRLSDGRAYAETVATGGASPVTLVRGGYITGPAGAPLGFYRRWPQSAVPRPTTPPDLAEDPLRTIATVTAVDFAYRIAVAGNETIDGVLTTHLVLRPVGDSAAYPLRDLWIGHDDDEVVRLTYELPYKRGSASITYDFAPIGKPPVWTIVRIAASAGGETISEELREIAFPPDEPDTYFTASLP